MESDTEVVTDVVLDALTNKQRQKEFKSAQKGIKSKDMDAKHTTLRKFIDSRYFTVGGCFVPFVNTLIPKKVKQ